jgi:enoyl-CoA hydratase/carnithine racemase
MEKSIIFEETKKIGIITLNREQVLNAWNKDMRL